ncbi:MAG: cysteine--tRNA ligase [Patescibacteria group bacterium]
MLEIYNTLTRKKEEFKPLKKNKVGLYTCGPTVYNYAHIGNLRTYVFEDILKRVLKYNNYKIKHIMNITDVGHLSSDSDEGEDKMEKGAKRENKTAYEIADFYTKKFQENLKDLNIIKPKKYCPATKYIKEQINFVKKLNKKGLTYQTSDGIYFDTTKINDYGKLANLEKQNLQAGSRVEMGEKKNIHDFAVWKFTKAGEKRQMEWKAFGKMGFPGWHLECSAISMKELGKQFDIHCGGIDHIQVHHTNEIAQSESLTGKKPWVKYWMHGEFLLLDKGDKMSKSSENFITLETLKEKNIDPLAYRYFLLQAHYRKQLNFSWEAIEAAQTGLNNLKNKIQDLKDRTKNNKNTELDSYFINKFTEFINDDLNTAGAIALIPEILKSNLDDKIKLNTILEFDEIFGLDLLNYKESNLKKDIKISTNINELLDQRKKAREEKNWAESDRLRDEIKKLGFEIKDGPDGQEII